MKTPVAFLIFNRPEKTQRVFEAIRKAKPRKLLVVADGSRPDKPGEAERCAETRAIIDRVDWECKVIKNYSDVNLGCGRRVSTGITWVFEQVEEAIILEDDCLPNQSFFQFCEQMLEKYREDERIMKISGTNLLGEWKSNSQSYSFSYYGGIWGWASWKRAWKYYDYEIKLWSKDEVRERIRDVLGSEEQFKAREEILWKAYHENKKYNWWDYQWDFARWCQSGLSIVPSVNLVTNIGFGEDATYTKNKRSSFANRPSRELKFPIEFKEFTVVDREYDKKLYEKVFKKENLVKKIKRKIGEMLYLINKE